MLNAQSLLILLIYGIVLFGAAYMGGRLSALGKMTHTRTQVIMSFVAGFILGIAMLHLLPHSLQRIPGDDVIEKAVTWMMFGIVVLVFFLHIFHFHQHDFSEEGSDLYDHHTHKKTGVKPQSLVGIALGLSLHTITEGVALGVSIQEGLLYERDAVVAGLGVFLAILLHKPLDAYSIIGMMRGDEYSLRTRLLANIGFALLCPLVTTLTCLIAGMLSASQLEILIGYALAFAAGAFLCISLSDLLPEIYFHSHDRGKLICALLMGIGLAYALYFIETGGMHGVEHASH